VTSAKMPDDAQLLLLVLLLFVEGINR